MRIVPALALTCLFSLQAADPTTAKLWTANQLKEVDKKLPGKINAALHLATERLLDSAFILHRDGNSTAEIHDIQADFIVFTEGEGAILIGKQGDKLIDGQRSGPGEVFRPFADRARLSTDWTLEEIDASHSPHITAPDLLTEVLLRAC